LLRLRTQCIIRYIKLEFPIDTELSLEALTAIDAYIEGAKSILQNQWISVDEALPVLVDKNSGKSEVVFATTDYHYNIFVAYYDYSNDTWYYNNYPGYDPQIYYEVTYWMPIPQN
jgi:hypothetical protein